MRRLPNGIPAHTTGSWFSTNINQSAYHALSGNIKNYSVVYKYRVINPIRVVHFNTITNFNKWSLNRGHVMTQVAPSFIVGAMNKNVAAKLCETGEYDGWSLPSLQRQMMICNPRKFLKFEGVYKVTTNNPSALNFVIGKNKRRYNYTYHPKNENVMWNSTNYKLQSINLANVRNIFEPNKNKIYWYYFNKRTPTFVNSLGKELARGTNSFVFGNNKKPSGIRLHNGTVVPISPNIKGRVNPIHMRTLKSRTGKNTWFWSVNRRLEV